MGQIKHCLIRRIHGVYSWFLPGHNEFYSCCKEVIVCKVSAEFGIHGSLEVAVVVQIPIHGYNSKEFEKGISHVGICVNEGLMSLIRFSVLVIWPGSIIG